MDQTQSISVQSQKITRRRTVRRRVTCLTYTTTYLCALDDKPFKGFTVEPGGRCVCKADSIDVNKSCKELQLQSSVLNRRIFTKDITSVDSAANYVIEDRLSGYGRCASAEFKGTMGGATHELKRQQCHRTCLKNFKYTGFSMNKTGDCYCETQSNNCQRPCHCTKNSGSGSSSPYFSTDGWAQRAGLGDTLSEQDCEKYAAKQNLTFFKNQSHPERWKKLNEAPNWSEIIHGCMLDRDKKEVTYYKYNGPATNSTKLSNCRGAFMLFGLECVSKPSEAWTHYNITKDEQCLCSLPPDKCNSDENPAFGGTCQETGLTYLSDANEAAVVKSSLKAKGWCKKIEVKKNGKYEKIKGHKFIVNLRKIEDETEGEKAPVNLSSIFRNAASGVFSGAQMAVKQLTGGWQTRKKRYT